MTYKFFEENVKKLDILCLSLQKAVPNSPKFHKPEKKKVKICTNLLTA